MIKSGKLAKLKKQNEKSIVKIDKFPLKGNIFVLQSITKTMDEMPSHAKRIKYEPQIYADLLANLTQLMVEVPKLRPNRDEWDIEGDWAATGTIHFVDAVHHQTEVSRNTCNLHNA